MKSSCGRKFLPRQRNGKGNQFGEAFPVPFIGQRLRIGAHVLGFIHQQRVFTFQQQDRQNRRALLARGKRAGLFVFRTVLQLDGGIVAQLDGFKFAEAGFTRQRSDHRCRLVGVQVGALDESLSWEHHRKVARIRDDFKKTRWLELAAQKKIEGKPISTRRLARSIDAGRLLTPAEMRANDTDRGIENCHPYVNSICAFWGKLMRSGWLDSATPEKREALRQDLRPVVEIYERLAG